MADAKRQSDGKTVWTLETDPNGKLSERLEDLRQIFDHYAQRTGDEATNMFIMRLLSVQSEALILAARRQEKEMEQLRADINTLKITIDEIQKPQAVTLTKPVPPKNNTP